MTGAFTLPDSNAVATLALLLRRLQGRVTKATVRDTLLRHPDYPSLLSLSDVLDNWKVNNMALQFDTVEQLQELPLPFVAHLNTKGGWYVLVTEIGDGFLTFIDSKRGIVREKTADFARNWTNVVLLAEVNEQSGEADYKQNHQTERLTAARQLLVGTAAILLFGFGLWRVIPTATAMFWGLIGTKVLGTVVTGLLLVHQVNSQHSLVSRICQMGQTGGCSGVLNSSAAKLTSWLSWSEVGFFYFSGGLLTLLVTGANQLSTTVLAGLAMLALPYVVYSVLYQARIAKTWCMLCLMVQALFVAEFLITLPAWPLRLPTEILPSVLIVGVSLVFPAVVYALLNPIVRAARQGQRDRIGLNRLKYNPAVFEFLLARQPRMPDWLPEQMITLGNADAAHTITMVTNPFCKPCSSMYGKIEKFILQNKTIRCELIFSVYDENDRIAGIATSSFSREYSDYRQVLQLATNWQAVGISDAMTTITEEIESDAVSRDHYRWCQEAKITATPTVFLNSNKLPITYELEDAMRLLSYNSQT